MSRIDFSKIPCPQGTTIIVEGKGKFVTPSHKRNIFFGISQAWGNLTGMGFSADEKFEESITLVSIDGPQKIVTVRIAEEPGTIRPKSHVA